MTLSVIRSMVPWWLTRKIVIFLQANLILGHLMMKCNELVDWSTFMDDTDMRSPMGVLVGSSSQTDFKSAWSRIFELTILSFASVTANINFEAFLCILFLASKVSYKWLVSICDPFAVLRITLTVEVSWFIWSWTLVFISICLLFASINRASKNLL